MGDGPRVWLDEADHYARTGELLGPEDADELETADRLLREAASWTEMPPGPERDAAKRRAFQALYAGYRDTPAPAEVGTGRLSAVSVAMDALDLALTPVARMGPVDARVLELQHRAEQLLIVLGRRRPSAEALRG